MYLMIDNYDSFVYNLKAYLEELGRDIMVRRSDEITIEEIEAMAPQGIILSPGPKRPWDAALCVETVKRFQGRVPLLGVCLGHQVRSSHARQGDEGASPWHGAFRGTAGGIQRDALPFARGARGYPSRRLSGGLRCR